MPTSQPGRRYILRSRIKCRICQRRMAGIARPARTGAIYLYYACPHNPANPRHTANHPDHPHVSVREDTLIDALAGFFDQYIFGHDRAALLAAQLPATTAGHADAQARKAAHLHTQLRRIDAAERGLISELEAPADPGDPAAAAYRARIRARYAELYNERTRTEADLAALQATATPDNDPTLLDELPFAASVLPGASDRIKQALLTAFDIHALYNNDDNQVTIWAPITSDTPRTIAALLNDPRTDDDTGQAATPPTSPNTISQLGQDTPVHPIHRQARIHRADPGDGAGNGPLAATGEAAGTGAASGAPGTRLITDSLTKPQPFVLDHWGEEPRWFLAFWGVGLTAEDGALKVLVN